MEESKDREVSKSLTNSKPNRNMLDSRLMYTLLLHLEYSFKYSDLFSNYILINMLCAHVLFCF